MRQLIDRAANGVRNFRGDFAQRWRPFIQAQQIGDVLSRVLGKFSRKILQRIFCEGEPAAGRAMGANHDLGR